MKKETNFETSPLNTQDAKAEAATTQAPDATNGDKIKALRTAQHMSMAELARRASMSDRAIRYIESNQREPSVGLHIYVSGDRVNNTDIDKASPVCDYYLQK